MVKIQDWNPLKRLPVFLAAGSFIFVLFLLAVEAALVYLGGWKPDSSVANFYWLMGVIGTVWGFERWWSYELGPCNPFHDHGYAS